MKFQTQDRNKTCSIDFLKDFTEEELQILKRIFDQLKVEIYLDMLDNQNDRLVCINNTLNRGDRNLFESDRLSNKYYLFLKRI